MKTLKRTLCLVLALVLALSTMAVASAAVVLKDKNEINPKYAEAVEVMNALGIIVGDQNGYFDPNGTLTRAQAAKLVSFVAFGNSVASLKSGSVCRFEDVADNSWASAWIELMAEAGAINGESATKFNPDGKLTGIAWAKLLLVALGYGQGDKSTEEVFVGPKWMFNVEKTASETQLFAVLEDDADFDLFDEITREEAAQMAFNAMVYCEYQDASVKHYVADGNGGYAVMTVKTPADLDKLAEYNYGLAWKEGVVYGDTMYTTESVKKFVIAAKSGTVAQKSATTEGMVEEYLTAENVELTDSLDAPHHAGCWTAVGKDGKSYQITDLVIFDESYGVKNDDIKAWNTARGAELNDALKTKWDDAHFEATGMYKFLNAKPENGLGASQLLGYKIDENETLTAYNFNAVKTYKSDAADADIDAVVSHKWYVAQVTTAEEVKKETGATKDPAYLGMYKYVFTVVDQNKIERTTNKNETYTVYGAKDAYSKDSFYTIVPNELYKVLSEKFDNGTLVALYGSDYTQVAENVFLEAPKALSTKTVNVSKVEYDSASKELTFSTNLGNFNASQGNEYSFFVGNLFKFDGFYEIHAEYWKDVKDDFLGDFDYIFYFDLNGELVAYEIDEDVEFAGYLANYSLVENETTVTGVGKSKTNFTVMANLVLADGTVKSLPVSYVDQNNQHVMISIDNNHFGHRGMHDHFKTNYFVTTYTEAQVEVNKLNKQLADHPATRVKYLALENTGYYTVYNYFFGALIDLDDVEIAAGVASQNRPGKNTNDNYNFADDTAIWNVTVKNEYPVVAAMPELVERNKVWVMVKEDLSKFNKDGYGKVNTSYNQEFDVVATFYDSYVAPTTEMLDVFVAPGTKYTKQSETLIDGQIYGLVTFDAYVDGVKTPITVKYNDVCFANSWGNIDVCGIDPITVMKCGGFYKVKKDLNTGIYNFKAFEEYVLTEVIRVAGSKFNFVAYDVEFDNRRAEIPYMDLKVRNSNLSTGRLDYDDATEAIAQGKVIKAADGKDWTYAVTAKYQEGLNDRENANAIASEFYYDGFIVSLAGAEEDGFVGYFIAGSYDEYLANAFWSLAVPRT